jgi:HlyD family secretion protein
MKQIGKWTILLMLFAVAGFGATLLVVNSGRFARQLAERGPVSSELQADVLADSPALEPASAVAEGAALPEAALAPVGSLAARQEQVAEPLAQGADVPLTAVGVVQLTKERQVVVAASGRVEQVAVEVGDTVTAGDLLVALDTTFLDWAVEQAEIAFQTARINFEELGSDIEASAIAVAEANLLLAQENLAEVSRGPSQEATAAAQSSNAAGWARYNELREQPTAAQINQALASLRKAEITVEGAQREYDKIAWLPEAAASAAADSLQRATIDLEAARAAYDEASRPATESQLQSALASAQSAQDALNELQRQPTAATLASAQASVAQAEAALEDARRGGKESTVRISELNVRQAMIGLEQARLAQSNAIVNAPVDGTVLAVGVELGEQVSAGSVVATLGDTRDTRLVVNVEQRDIARVTPGQAVQVSIYALPDAEIVGVVDRIAPVASSGTGFVTFPVIIRLVEGPLERVLPGMTASAAFLPDDAVIIDEDAGADADVDAASSEEPEASETPEAIATPEATVTPGATESPAGSESPAADTEATPEPDEEAESESSN